MSLTRNATQCLFWDPSQKSRVILYDFEYFECCTNLFLMHTDEFSRDWVMLAFVAPCVCENTLHSFIQHSTQKWKDSSTARWSGQRIRCTSSLVFIYFVAWYYPCTMYSTKQLLKPPNCWCRRFLNQCVQLHSCYAMSTILVIWYCAKL